jgi:fluoride exporter
MTLATFGAVFFGGGLGAALRWVLAGLVGGGPWAIFLINVTGSVVMGVLIGLFEQRWAAPMTLRSFLTTGILGGYTTFSTFSMDAVLLIERGQWGQALLYVIGSIAAGVAGCFIAMRLAAA